MATGSPLLEPRREVPAGARDLEVLRFVARHGMVSPDQLRAGFFRSAATAGQHLHALAASGLITRQRVVVDLPEVIRATPRGTRLSGCDLPPANLDLARIRHSLALVDLALELLAAHPGGRWTTERELRRDRMRAARARGRWEPLRRVPDGLLELSDGRRVAVELDLTPKRSTRLDLLAGAYAVDPDVDVVWWYLPSRRAAHRMLRVVTERGLEHLIEPRTRDRGLAAVAAEPALSN
ncbi:MAG TPA: hypothetical protein VEK76_12970 [Candidatus Binatia bacterium]|nr:hypothetical protein [Candidatus Binatia bacterium]